MKHVTFLLCLLFLLCPPLGAAQHKKNGTHAADKPGKRHRIRKRRFFMQNLRLFLEYELYLNIELYRYYAVVKLTETKEEKK